MTKYKWKCSFNNTLNRKKITTTKLNVLTRLKVTLITHNVHADCLQHVLVMCMYTRDVYQESGCCTQQVILGSYASTGFLR